LYSATVIGLFKFFNEYSALNRFFSLHSSIPVVGLSSSFLFAQEIRPVYVWKNLSINVHFLSCFVSLIILLEKNI